MTKIIEKILEPTRIEVGSIFKIKIKAIRYASYNELKNNLNYLNTQKYQYNQLKGD